MSTAPRIVVYTAITGGKDRLKENQVTAGLPFYAFLDEPVESDTWEVLPAMELFKDPRRNARCHKILAHQLFPDCEYSVWIDGTISVISDILPLIDGLMAGCDVATFRHPERRCLYKEAKTCMRFSLDDRATIEKQVAYYQGKNFAADAGLFETNVLIRRHCPRVAAFNNLWWSELCFHSNRDQISFPYAAWSTGLRIGIIPGNAQNLPHINPRRCGSEYFSWQKHLRL